MPLTKPMDERLKRKREAIADSESDESEAPSVVERVFSTDVFAAEESMETMMAHLDHVETDEWPDDRL